MSTNASRDGPWRLLRSCAPSIIVLVEGPVGQKEGRALHSASASGPTRSRRTPLLAEGGGLDAASSAWLAGWLTDRPIDRGCASCACAMPTPRHGAIDQRATRAGPPPPNRLLLGRDERDALRWRGQLLRLVVGNLDAERLLHRHDELRARARGRFQTVSARARLRSHRGARRRRGRTQSACARSWRIAAAQRNASARTSTASRLSAPRSSVNDAFGVTLDASTPSCSAMMAFTFSSTAAFIATGALSATRLADTRECAASGAEKALA